MSHDVAILGRRIGTATASEWLTDSPGVMVLHDFRPAPRVRLNAFERLNVDLNWGYFETYSDNGVRLTRVDILDVIGHLKR